MRCRSVWCGAPGVPSVRAGGPWGLSHARGSQGLARARARAKGRAGAAGAILRTRLLALARADRLRVPDAGGSRRAARQSLAGPLDLTSNDYLGLGRVSRETPVQGAKASRMVFGTTPEHRRLEAALARWLGTEGSLLFSSGFAANSGVLSALVQPGDVVFSDSLNHASIIDGCRLARGETRIYPHLDLAALARGLELAQSTARGGHRWIVTEAYFSMDGDTPDLSALAGLAKRYRASLIVDEAHSLGVFGPEGRGLCAAAGVTPAALVGTFGKAFGLQGAFVAGGRPLMDYLWNTARPFVFSTAPSPTLASALSERLTQVRRAGAGRRDLSRLGEGFRDALGLGGLPRPPGKGPIVSVTVGTERAALAAARVLAQRGLRVQAIRPPTVPVGTCRLRITLKAAQEPNELNAAAALVCAAVQEAAGNDS